MANNTYQLFVVGAAGDLEEEIPESLKCFGSESHWAESMSRLNASTGLVSAHCVLCCPCFVAEMMLGGGMKDHLAAKVHG
jgi:hypothetical protein